LLQIFISVSILYFWIKEGEQEVLKLRKLLCRAANDYIVVVQDGMCMSLLTFLTGLSPIFYHILAVLRRKGIRAGMTCRLPILSLYRAVTFRREFVRCAKYVFVSESVNDQQAQMYCIPLGGNRPYFIQTLVY
jgi:hypothetical protein